MSTRYLHLGLLQRRLFIMVRYYILYHYISVYFTAIKTCFGIQLFNSSNSCKNANATENMTYLINKRHAERKPWEVYLCLFFSLFICSICLLNTFLSVLVTKNSKIEITVMIHSKVDRNSTKQSWLQLIITY